LSKPNGSEIDVLVVGAGNAALCGALAAHEAGAKVVVIEAAPLAERGGNSTYTAGAMRFAYENVDQYRMVVADLLDTDLQNVDFGSYSEDQFFDDMGRLCDYRSDPDLTETLVRYSRQTLIWMRSKGVRFQPSLGRQAFKVEGKFKFWGGVSCEVSGGGPGLVDSLHKAAERSGIKVYYDTRMVGLVYEGRRVRGVMVDGLEDREIIRARSVLLACGGFESNAAMRAQYLGRNWDLAKVRGSRFNMGDGIRSALAIGALPHGHWSGAHAVAWDLNAPAFGDLAVGDGFQKHSYPFGIVVNAHGRRFIDEGADFRNYTYAKYGQEILAQPGMFAWQIFDSKVVHLLRDEYRIRKVTRIRADSLEELAQKMEGIDPAGFLETVAAYNKSVKTSVPFNPNIKDGRRTVGLEIPKSNWANTIDTPPFEAYGVTCGVTFTFGGVKIGTNGEVLEANGQAIPGLYAAGEMVGGLFYFNYPGGTGLTAGAVFGKVAGASAAAWARSGSL
jgi:tricarballylate dehydrogenase